jgi:hypothetical protein
MNESYAAPPALRLIRAPGASSPEPRPPFGLARFDDAATSIAVEVAREEALASLLERLPPPGALEPNAVVVVLGSANRTLLARALGRNQPVDRALRASALLARGYSAIEAFVDARSGDDLVVGRARP